MIRRLTLLLTLGCLWLAPLAAEERFPPPEFKDYQIPSLEAELQHAPPRSNWQAWTDVAVLAVTLGLAAYLGLKARSRKGLFVLMVFCLLYFGFYRKGCICPIGAIQNVAYAIGPNGYPLPWGAALFFALPLLFALFLGRVFCGAVCPLGAAQDLVLLRPMKLPPALEFTLSFLPYVYLAFAVLWAALGATFLICEYDPYVAFLRMDGSFAMLVLGGSMLVIGLYVGRPYCRFVCPYGVLLGWLSPLAKARVKIHPQTCVQCRLCEDACPFGAIRSPTQELPPEQRLAGRTRLIVLLALLPVFVLGLGGLGWLSGNLLAGRHFSVALAERVHAEEQGTAQGLTDESDAWRKKGRPLEELYGEAEVVKARFRMGAAVAGAFLGLVLGLRLIRLSIRRTRVEYDADPLSCVSCARCYLACPGEHQRRGLIGGAPPA